ncbi:MAG: PilZ domain-containing protein [Proteobacteria bacterium]|nr:PilZ domain-containing protein [Pseudomonadota bacterium]
MEKEYEDLEKRNYSRQKYSSQERPTLKIGIWEFIVKDISAKGLCLVDNKKINLTGWVSGTLVFSDNTSQEIDGIVVRKKDGEIGLHLVTSISL